MTSRLGNMWEVVHGTPEQKLRPKAEQCHCNPRIAQIPLLPPSAIVSFAMTIHYYLKFSVFFSIEETFQKMRHAHSSNIYGEKPSTSLDKSKVEERWLHLERERSCSAADVNKVAAERENLEEHPSRSNLLKRALSIQVSYIKISWFFAHVTERHQEGKL